MTGRFNGNIESNYVWSYALNEMCQVQETSPLRVRFALNDHNRFPIKYENKEQESYEIQILIVTSRETKKEEERGGI